MMINTQGSMIDYKLPLDYERMNACLDVLAQRYPMMSVTSIGQTVLGRRIPMISIGRGKKSVLYVGGCEGVDTVSASVLMRYVNEYCDYITSESRIYNCSAAYLFATRTVVIIPMLNPDGVEYCIHGVREDNPLYERIQSADTEKWRGNARGVELRDNFGDSFENICFECEQETGALRNYLMFNRDIKLVMSLNKGKSEVVCTHEGSTPPRLNSIGESLARMCACDYKREHVSGSLSCFCAAELVTPCFELNGAYTDGSDIFGDYVRLRKSLFLAPTLI